MQVIPAIDLRDGACVQLVGGSYADERVRIANPLAVAENWARLGFGRMHLVDLDAATGRGSNREIVKAILAMSAVKSKSPAAAGVGGGDGSGPSLEMQCGGGVRSVDDLRALADVGVSATIIGMALYTGMLDPQTIIEEFPV